MLYSRPNNLPHARLGVVAAKRFAPRAVTRNTIKRITRELFRTTALPAIDCVVRLARPVNSKDGPATNARLKAALRVELARLFAAQARMSRPPPAGGRSDGRPAAAGPDAAGAVAGGNGSAGARPVEAAPAVLPSAPPSPY